MELDVRCKLVCGLAQPRLVASQHKSDRRLSVGAAFHIAVKDQQKLSCTFRPVHSGFPIIGHSLACETLSVAHYALPSSTAQLLPFNKCC